MFRQAVIRLAQRESTMFHYFGGANSNRFYNTTSARRMMQMSTTASSSLTNIASRSGSAEPSVSGSWRPQLTKIVATIGPTSEQLPVLKDLVRCGLRIMRLNFSHATVEEVELRIANLKQCEGRHGNIQHEKDGERNVRAVLLDTRGPEIRMGKLKNDFSGHETIHLTAGNEVNLRTSEDWSHNGSTETDIFIDYPKLHKVLSPGSKILLDDGAIILTVKDVESSKEFHGNVVCTIDNSGDLRSRAGVNLPGAETDLPALSVKDKVDIRYGMTKDVDYIAASFVQSAAHVREIKAYVKQCAQELEWDPSYPLPLIISKIESQTALKNFDEILKESDGIMVARGDLGVEIPIHQVTNAQKEMVAACNAVGKPVIVATQMLESMAKNPRPTRAEVSDVTNAVYDGADAVMTSGETAKGKYPVETIKMMNEIIASAEQFAVDRPDLVSPSYGGKIFANNTSEGCIEASIAKATVAAATKRGAAAIIVLAKIGSDLPRLVSAYRPNVPIVTFVPSSKMARQLILNRGIHPVVGALSGVSFHKRPAIAIKRAKEMGFVNSCDDVVIVGIEDDEKEEFGTMKVTSVP
mmetsp:Transcript_4235/g.8100  ORF Transcript_4235/g.8100 Transcript_4235/m.8100 type:complete len:581 (+) Transcript_4235:140-1882(+)